jgi:arylsulfatase A-like enzyme
MNFQTVSTGEKLPVSDGLQGGYNPDGTPGPLLLRSLTFVDSQIGTMLQRIRNDGLASKTTIILSAKHGQSPIDPTLLRRVDDGAIIDNLNTAWSSAHPGAKPLVAFTVDDDGMLFWLSDRSATALDFAKSYLLGHNAPANTINDAKGVYSTTVAASGLTAVYTGTAADSLVGAQPGDSHAPDLIGIGQHGVVYTGGVKKIAEHGGAADDDLNVALVAFGAGVDHKSVGAPVQTTQIAPTILSLLGLNPHALDAVKIDHTTDLPGL